VIINSWNPSEYQNEAENVIDNPTRITVGEFVSRKYQHYFFSYGDQHHRV
jgi:hypothetical protein